MKDTIIATNIKFIILANSLSNTKIKIGTKHIDKMNEPIEPETVLLGLIFVNFFL